jgi:membrane protein DedA with SNARE-associated domain
MNIDMLLVQYGVAAIFVFMFMKSVGVPIPIPADVIILAAAAGAAAGKLVLWQAFVAILLAIVLGSLLQFILARGPGRGVLYRFGRYVGLTAARLDAASVKVKKGGVVTIGLAILVPGIRGVAIVAAGLADVPIVTFTSGLVLGSLLFLTFHFFLGFLGGTLLLVISHALPPTWAIVLILALFVAAYALWVVASRRQKAARQELDAASLEVWHEGICPVCLALYTANQLNTETIQLKV